MTTTIKRYGMDWPLYESYPDEYGEWCEWEDVATLLTELDRLRAEVAMFEGCPSQGELSWAVDLIDGYLKQHEYRVSRKPMVEWLRKLAKG